MLKKYLYIIGFTLSVFLSSTDIYAAGSSCPIEGKSALVLDNYIKDVRVIVNNVTGELSTAQANNPDKVNEKLKTDGNDIRRIFNEMISWNGFYTSFEYYAVFPISNEVPYEFTRDHKRLEQEVEGLTKYLKQITKRGYGGVVIDNACSGVTSGCELTGNATDIIGELTSQTSSLSDLYRKIVLSKETTDHQPIQFTGKDFNLFVLELKKSYGSQALEACSDKEGGFLDKIKAAIAKINFTNSDYENGVQKWKDSWDRLIGVGSDREYYDYERKLLETELSRQGISGSNKEQILKNLDNFNDTGITKENNVLTNSFNLLAESISSQWDSFKESISDSFPQEEEQVSINTFQDNLIQNDIDLEISQSIGKAFHTELPFTQIENKNTADIRLRIIKLHNSVSQSINVLQDTVKVSQKVCNKQDNGNGNCN